MRDRSNPPLVLASPLLDSFAANAAVEPGTYFSTTAASCSLGTSIASSTSQASPAPSRRGVTLERRITADVGKFDKSSTVTLLPLYRGLRPQWHPNPKG